MKHSVRQTGLYKSKLVFLVALALMLGNAMLTSCRQEPSPWVVQGSASDGSSQTYGFRFEPKSHTELIGDRSLLRMVTDDEVLTVLRPLESFKEKELEQGEIEWIAPLLPENRLVMVELDHESSPLVRGERKRWGPLALVELPAAASAHKWLGTHRFFVAELETYEGPMVHDTLTYRSPWALGGHDFAGSDVDRAFLEQKVAEFSGAKSFETGSGSARIMERGSDAGRLLARKWIREQFESIGYVVTEHTYRGRFSEGVNLVAEKAGKNSARSLILSAHYDSVGNAGADDNGAGVVAMLGVAQGLKNTLLDINLKMVFFDQEEKGLVGSKAYVDFLKSSGELGQVVGNINFEMLGFNGRKDGAFHVIDCNENTSARLSQGFLEVLNSQPDLELHRVKACTNRSDHASFWRYGKPAVVVSQNFFGGDGNPCYHEACDKVDRMDFDYMLRLTKLTEGAVLSLISRMKDETDRGLYEG